MTAATNLRIGDWFYYRGEPVRVLSAVRDHHEYRTVHVTFRYPDGAIRNCRLHDNEQVTLTDDPDYA